MQSMHALLAGYGVVSLITMIIYMLDKRASIRNRRRVPESTLHLLALLGGFPGALLAQQVFRHKRRKFWFMAVTIFIALLHVSAWTCWYILMHYRD